MRPTFVSTKELVGHEFLRPHALALFLNVRFFGFLTAFAMKCNMKVEDVIATAAQILYDAEIEQEP